ncbi:MAG TPA: hypothetical protein VMP01_17880 [Pirellulaceae bacterium]|nr:hypothetical protein [Pirellulaceae bacterium]
MFKFTLRDLLWLTAVVALGVAWLDQKIKLGVAESQAMQSGARLSWLVDHMASKGYRIDWNESQPAAGWFVRPSIPAAPNVPAPAPNLPTD